MDAQTFNAFLEGKLNDIRDILASKGAEYVPEGTVEKSRFHNFEVSAALNGSTKEQALWGFVTKHIVSLADMIKDEPLDHSLAKWDEKIGDISVYMVLLHAMVYEAHDNADMVKVAMKEYADHVSRLEDVSIKSDPDPESKPSNEPPPNMGANFYPSGLQLISDIDEQERKRDVASQIMDMAIHTSVGLVPNDHVATPSEPRPPEYNPTPYPLRTQTPEEMADATLKEMRQDEPRTPEQEEKRIAKMDAEEQKLIEKNDGLQANVVVVSDPSGLLDNADKTGKVEFGTSDSISDADKQHRAWMARVTPPGQRLGQHF